MKSSRGHFGHCSRTRVARVLARGCAPSRSEAIAPREERQTGETRCFVSVECANLCKLYKGEGGGWYECSVLSCAWKAPRVLTGSLASTTLPRCSAHRRDEKIRVRRKRWLCQVNAGTLVIPRIIHCSDLVLAKNRPCDLSLTSDFFAGRRFLLPVGGEEKSPYVGRRNEATGKARTARYILVRQLIGMRTGRYRAVPLKSIVDGRFQQSAVDFDRQRSIEGEIDHRRSIKEEKGKRKKKKRKIRKKKRRRGKVPRPRTLAAHG
ncbi:hypothetical protein GW17_00005091 [Ensete ventricosum]|nr:hypothetical protein GW17_00005091 [Ensete ventricosum]